MSQLQLRDCLARRMEAARKCRAHFQTQVSEARRALPALSQQRPAGCQRVPLGRPSISCFLVCPLPGGWGVDASLTPDISKCCLFLPTVGRIFNKPEKPLGRLPACVPPVSILMTWSPGRGQLARGPVVSRGCWCAGLWETDLWVLLPPSLLARRTPAWSAVCSSPCHGGDALARAAAAEQQGSGGV